MPVLAGVILAYGVCLLMYCGHRVIDGDEGFYISAARLVGEAKLPYLDFFYPQAPTLPIVYGIWTTLGGYSLVFQRILSALLTTATVALWAWFLFSEYRLSPWVAGAAFLVLLCNPFLISWGVVVKTFALGNFLLTLTLVGLWRFIIARSTPWLFIAGAGCALLVSTRSLYAAVPLVVAGWLFIRGRVPNGVPRKREIAVFMAGLVVASIHTLTLFIIDPEVFIFNNVGYHLLRSDKPAALAQFTGAVAFVSDVFVHHPYMILQLLLAGLGTYFLWKEWTRSDTRSSSLAAVTLASAVALVITSITPFPLYEQYFTSPLAPLGVPLVALGVRFLVERNRMIVFALMLVTVSLSAMEIRDEYRQASAMQGWQVGTFENVVSHIKRHTSATDTIISPWPGYASESGRKFMPGFENQFGLPIAEHLTPEERQRYRIADRDSFITALEGRRAAMVIMGAWISPLFVGLDEETRERLYRTLEEHYNLAQEIDGAFIYTRKEDRRTDN